MARTAVNSTNVTRAGVAPAAAVACDAVNKNYVVNDGNLWLECANTDTAAHTISLQFAAMHDGQAVTPRTISIPASASRLIGPFSINDYGNVLNFDSDSALVTVKAYRLVNA